jgi:hypothetical protein
MAAAAHQSREGFGRRQRRGSFENPATASRRPSPPLVPEIAARWNMAWPEIV